MVRATIAWGFTALGSTMRSLLFVSLLGIAGGLISPRGYAGEQSPPAVAQAQEPLATGGLISSLLAAPVAGEPYSAVQVHGTTQTLPDGSTVSHHGHHAVARDAEGRVHVELRMARGQNGAPDEVMVFVMDPVAHTLTTWLSGATGQPKVATVFKVPPGQQTAEAPPRRDNPRESARPQPVITTDDLAAQTIEGLEATGKRTTTIVPVGRSGNSAPITKTHEVWTSSELQLVVKQKWTDPRLGERTVELKNISRANPDPALFRPPTGYETKNAVETLKELEEKLNATQQ
jgi:hypothetical protein